jgi:flagellar P-ring protein FlgI
MKNILRRFFRDALSIAALTLAAAPAPAARLKELASIEGVRDNQLVGYGLVVGLNGTGDKRQTFFSAQTLTNLLERMGVSVDPRAIQVRNTAAAMITATLPPFGQPGTKIDVTVAAIGDATNLQGGLLVMTPLNAATGEVYAVAQGPVLTGGFVAGRGGSSVSSNFPTAARIPDGAIVERAAPSELATDVLRFQIREVDFTTANRIAAAINAKFGDGSKKPASALNSGLVEVSVPTEYKGRTVEFVSLVESLPVDADHEAKIVVNERTGTIVLGKDVKINPVAILHGALSVEIRTTFDVSQPAALSQGKTVVTPDVGVGVKEEAAKQIVLHQGASVEELVRALLSIGSTPRDIISILQNLKSAGALDAELEVI